MYVHFCQVAHGLHCSNHIIKADWLEISERRDAADIGLAETAVGERQPWQIERWQPYHRSSARRAADGIKRRNATTTDGEQRVDGTPKLAR